MKRFLTALLLATLCANAYARVYIPNDSTEEKKQVVTGGFKLQCVGSHMIIHQIMDNLYSVPGISGEIGGFIDFNCTKHLIVQVNLLLGAEHMGLRNESVYDDLWIFGLNMPVYVLGRFEFGRQSAIQFGGGPFSTFVFRGLMYGDSSPEPTDPFKRVYSSDDLTGEDRMVLSDNYSGLGICVGYEFYFGLQFNLGYQCALTDILNYPHTVSFARPQKWSLGIAYRF